MVGGAAMAFDPISLQGIMTALEMGYCAGTLLGPYLLKVAADESYSFDGEDTGLEWIYTRAKEEYNTHRANHYSLGKKHSCGKLFDDVAYLQFQLRLFVAKLFWGLGRVHVGYRR